MVAAYGCQCLPPPFGEYAHQTTLNPWSRLFLHRTAEYLMSYSLQT